MRLIGIPTCPYCRKRVNIIRTWSLKRQGEYQCPRCGGISNIYLSPLIYVLALLAIFAGGSVYFFHKFVLDDISLETALHVFIPFAAFFLLSLFMVYLEKPVIKKVAKSEYGRKRRKNAQEDSGLPRGAQEYAEFSGNYPARGSERQRHTEAPRQVSINQENFNRAKQQTATINAIHESGMAPPRQAVSQANQAVQQRQQPAQRTAPQQAARQAQAAPPASQTPREARQASQPVSQQIPQQRVSQRTAPMQRPVEAVEQRESAVQRKAEVQEPVPRQMGYQRPAARQMAGGSVEASAYQRPARTPVQQMEGAPYQRPAAQSSQRLEPRQRVNAQQSEANVGQPAARQQEAPLTNFHSQAMQRQREAQQYASGQPNSLPTRNLFNANRPQLGQPYSPTGQTARPQPPVNLANTGYARHRNPYSDENK